MTDLQQAVLTVTGECGKSIKLPVLGILIEVRCAHGVQVPENHEEASQSHGYFPSGGIAEAIFSGSGGGTALVGEVGDHAQSGVSDDHLLVIGPDGRLGAAVEDYRAFINALGTYREDEATRTSSVSVNIDEAAHSFLSHDVDDDAKPYVIVSSPQIDNIRADHLSATLRTAAAANAPVHLFTL